jgi:hypothetical protein
MRGSISIFLLAGKNDRFGKPRKMDFGLIPQGPFIAPVMPGFVPESQGVGLLGRDLDESASQPETGSFCSVT